MARERGIYWVPSSHEVFMFVAKRTSKNAVITPRLIVLFFWLLVRTLSPKKLSDITALFGIVLKQTNTKIS